MIRRGLTRTGSSCLMSRFETPSKLDEPLFFRDLMIFDMSSSPTSQNENWKPAEQGLMYCLKSSVRLNLSANEVPTEMKKSLKAFAISSSRLTSFPSTIKAFGNEDFFLPLPRVLFVSCHINFMLLKFSLKKSDQYLILAARATL